MSYLHHVTLCILAVWSTNLTALNTILTLRSE